MNNSDRGMRSIDFMMLGLGSMIGVGWTVAVNDWIGTAGGVLPAMIAFLIGTIVIIPIGLCYAEMAGMMPVTGGVIAYAYQAKGTRLSFMGGWYVQLAYIVLLPWESIFIGEILYMIFPFLKSGKPLYRLAGYDIYLPMIALGIAIALILTYINIRGAEASGKFQTSMSLIIIGVGLIVVAASVFKGDFSNLKPFHEDLRGAGTSAVNGILSLLVVVPFFLAGFDTIPQAVGDAKDKASKRKVPWIIVLSIISAGLFYILIIFAGGFGVPWKEFVSYETPAVSVMMKVIYGESLGSFLYWLVMFGALAGLLTTYNGMFLAASRLMYGMSRARYLPVFFQLEHDVYETPVGAILFCMIAAMAGPFLGLGTISPLTNVGSLGFVMGWLITSYSTFKLRYHNPEIKRPFRIPKGLYVSILAIFISLCLVALSVLPFSAAFMGLDSVVMFAVWSVLGLVFYAASWQYRHRITELKRMQRIYGHEIASKIHLRLKQERNIE